MKMVIPSFYPRVVSIRRILINNKRHRSSLRSKCVLNPANSLADTTYWAKSELDLFPLTTDLHRVLKESMSNENEYKHYMNRIKNSVLTAFYTPPAIVNNS